MCPDAAALAAAAAFEALFLANSSFSRALRLTASGDIPVGESEGRAKNTDMSSILQCRNSICGYFQRKQD